MYNDGDSEAVLETVVHPIDPVECKAWARRAA